MPLREVAVGAFHSRFGRAGLGGLNGGTGMSYVAGATQVLWGDPSRALTVQVAQAARNRLN